MSVGLLTLHLIVAVAHVGLSTHQATFAWRAARRGAGWGRATRLAGLVALTGLAASLLGAIIYPEYKVHVRAAWLEAAAPHWVRLFDLKEHLVALSLATHAGAWVMARGGKEGVSAPPSRPLYLSLTTLGAALVWIGGVIGGALVAWQGIPR